jgi:hypothetical protein
LTMTRRPEYPNGERPPDVGWNDLWWEHCEVFSRYTNRLSWLMSGGVPVAEVAILTVEGHTPWRAAKTLFESQIDFFYLDESLLPESRIFNGRLRVGDMSCSVLVLDGIDARLVCLLFIHGLRYTGRVHLNPCRNRSGQAKWQHGEPV